MFCTRCGAPADDDANFCTKCGVRLDEAGQSGATVVPPVPPANPPKGKGKAIAIALVLLACIVVIVALVMRPGCSGESMPTSSTASGSQSEQGSDAGEVPDPAAYERVNGWWQSVGQSGSVYHHFVDGTDYVYLRNLEDQDDFSYNGTRAYSVEPFEVGELSFTDDSGVAVLFDGGETYILEDADEGFLTCRNLDGSGYSGSSSLGRPASGDMPEGLVELVAQVESADSASEPVAENPASLDVSGDGYGDMATLTGVVARQDMTPADTGMVWGAAVYYLELPEPVTITYNGPTGDAETQVFNRILVWADEANPTVSAEDEYYAEHPDEMSTEYDQYIGRTITVCGYVIDAGTAHYFGSGCFFDPEIVG